MSGLHFRCIMYRNAPTLFVSQTFTHILRRFGHLSHSYIKTRRRSVDSLYFQTFWPTRLNSFWSFGNISVHNRKKQPRAHRWVRQTVQLCMNSFTYINSGTYGETACRHWVAMMRFGAWEKTKCQFACLFFWNKLGENSLVLRLDFMALSLSKIWNEIDLRIAFLRHRFLPLVPNCSFDAVAFLQTHEFHIIACFKKSNIHIL